MFIPQLPSKYEQFKEQACNIVDSSLSIVPLSRKMGVWHTGYDAWANERNGDGGQSKVKLRRLTAHRLSSSFRVYHPRCVCITREGSN